MKSKLKFICVGLVVASLSSSVVFAGTDSGKALLDPIKGPQGSIEMPVAPEMPYIPGIDQTENSFEGILEGKVNVSVNGDTLSLDWGQKPTGGYSIEIVRIDKDAAGRLVVEYKTTSPGPEDIATQALTYPTDSKEIPSEHRNFSGIVLKNTDGSEERVVSDSRIPRQERVFAPGDIEENIRLRIGRIESLISQGEPQGLLELKERLSQRFEHIANIDSMTDKEKNEAMEREVKDRLYIRGEKLEYDVAPVIIQGRTLVPLRAISEGLGAMVDWDEDTRIATVQRSGRLIEVDIDSGKVLVDGIEREIDIPAQLINNRTMVPLRFISEFLGESVDFNEETGDIDIGLDLLNDLEDLE